jgi:hypothetical protein
LPYETETKEVADSTGVSTDNQAEENFNPLKGELSTKETEETEVAEGAEVAEENNSIPVVERVPENETIKNSQSNEVPEKEKDGVNLQQKETDATSEKNNNQEVENKSDTVKYVPYLQPQENNKLASTEERIIERVKERQEAQQPQNLFQRNQKSDYSEGNSNAPLKHPNLVELEKKKQEEIPKKQAEEKPKSTNNLFDFLGF